MKTESKIKFYFDHDGEDLQKIIDEFLLKKYIAEQKVCLNA